MKRQISRIFLMVWALVAGCWLLAACAWAQSNAPTGDVLHVPAFDIPLPAQLAAWVAAHGFVLWCALRVAVKTLDGYETKYPWVTRVVWLLEHCTFVKNVVPLRIRVSQANWTRADQQAGRAGELKPQHPPAPVDEAPKSTAALKTSNGLPMWIVALLSVGYLLSIQPSNAAAQSNNPVWAGSSVPLSTNPVINALQQVGQRVDVGATLSFRYGTTHLQEAGGASVLGAVQTRTNNVTSAYSLAWQWGPAFTVVPAWNELDAGLGASVGLLKLPDNAYAAQTSVPVVGAATPKLLVLRGFGAVEADVGSLGQKSGFRAVVGGSLPMGP